MNYKIANKFHETMAAMAKATNASQEEQDHARALALGAAVAYLSSSAAAAVLRIVADHYDRQNSNNETR